MLFDPEDGMTLEQSIEIAWNNLLSPSMRADVEAIAGRLGWTRHEVILECRRMVLKDPAKLAILHAGMERAAAPFGKDPLLRKDGD